MVGHGLRTRRWKIVALGLVLAVLLAGAAPVGAVGTVFGTLKVRVWYPGLSGGFYRLPGVAVQVHDQGGKRFACADDGGIATFPSVPAGGGYVVQVEGDWTRLQCANGELLHPATHLKMYGESLLGVSVSAGTTTTVDVYLDPPPEDQMLVCGGMHPDLVGTPGPDVLVGTAGPDIISAGAGNDTIYGYGGSDILCGGRGKDRLMGGLGNDFLFGDLGDDSGGNRGLFGGKGEDMLYGGYGVDHCEGEIALGCE